MAAPTPPLQDPDLAVLLGRIVPALRAEAVYLFGSRARGDSREGSDYDLLVVVPDDLPADRRSLAAAYRAKCGTGIPADIIPCRRSVFERRKTSLGTLSYAAWHEGTRIYGA